MRTVLVAALAASSVQAAPRPQVTGLASAVAPWPTNSTSSTVSPAEASAKAAANKMLSEELAQEPTQVDRFKHLLTSDDAAAMPLDPGTLRQRLVFDFNAAAAGKGALGTSIWE
jgi:hypothetical protein